jgi:hypothetical protein
MTAKSISKPALRGFDKDLAELEALAAAFKANPVLSESGAMHLSRALEHRNNFLVSKAAKLVAEAEVAALLPDLLTAYDRFFIDASATDPQCWAKNALAKALVKLEHRQKDVYLRGLRHHQMEGSWGEPSDTAGALRGTCLHALVDCPGIPDAELLAILIESLIDTDKTVRMEAARAIGQVGGVSAGLLLRLRILLGSDEPEVLGACFSALLDLERENAIPLVAAALKEGDELSAEAAYALAELRSSETWSALRERWRKGADSWFASVLLSAMALTRLPEAMEFLIGMIEQDSREAVSAIEALGSAAPTAEVRLRLQQAVEQGGSERLRQAFNKHFPSQTN